VPWTGAGTGKKAPASTWSSSFPLQEVGEAGGMPGIQADVFVHVKDVHAAQAMSRRERRARKKVSCELPVARMILANPRGNSLTMMAAASCAGLAHLGVGGEDANGQLANVVSRMGVGTGVS